MMKYSFIVCIYNGENYIDQCLESILHQSFQGDYEILLIDDGSTDNSVNKLKAYADKYSNIRVVINEQNIGLSASRNKGVELAKGKYFSFVDIDDYLSKDYLQCVDEHLSEDVDILKFNLSYVEDSNIIKQHYDELPNETVNGEYAIQFLIEAKVVFEPAVLYVFNKDYYMREDFGFGVGHIHEDFGLIPIAIIKASRILLIDDNLYYYVQTSDSITRGITPEKQLRNFKSIVYFFETNRVIIQSLNVSKDCKTTFNSFLANALIGSFDRLSDEDKHVYGKLINQQAIPLLRDNSMMRKIKKLSMRFKYRKYS